MSSAAAIGHLGLLDPIRHCPPFTIDNNAGGSEETDGQMLYSDPRPAK